MNKSKDPRKVAAGKARAAKALRDEKGRLKSTSFKEEVKRYADAAGMHTGDTHKLQRFYDQNPDKFENFLSQESRSQNRYSIKTIEATAKRTTKKTFLEIEGEREEASADEISYRMARFEQYCYTHRNCTGVAWKKQRLGTGDPIVKMPDIDNEELDEMDDIEFIDYCANFGIIVWISDLKKLKDKNKRLQRQTSATNKLKYAKRRIRETNPRKGKSRTHPRKR